MAIQNEVQNAELAYLLFPFEQYSNLNGKPLVGGHIEVFEAGTSNKYITYQDWDGDSNPFKISIPEDGRIVALADPSLAYDVYVYDSFNNLVCSRLNVQCNVPGNISIKGADTRIKNTDGTLDISLQTQANNVREYTVNTRNKLLDVQSPLYFVENSQSATIIGIKGGASGYVTKDYVDSVVSDKLDITAFSAVSGDFLTDKFEYDDNFNITGYDGSAFASNGQTYSAGTNIDITDNVISVTGLPTSSDVENAISSAVTNVENKFEYNENNYITAYNNSAFAGTNYSAGDYVSIENDTISVTGLQPSGDYATKTELESATSGKMDVTGMTAYQPSGDYATHDDLTAYQPVGDYYSASNPSGFITNDAITGLQPSGNYATKEDVESATSGKQDTLSAGDGISIVNNTISVTSQGGGIEQVNHDDTLSGNGNDEPLGIANIEDFVKQNDLTAYQEKGDYYSASNPSGFITNDAITGLQPSGDYATHDDLTGYATTSLVSSVSSELYSAISGISGDFELVAGSGVELVDDPNAKTTTINVTAEGTPVTAIEQMIESATSGLQPSGDYATTAQLADKLDTTAFSTVSGDFLTAHQDISNLMPKSESANFYPMTGNPSGFLTAHQDISNKLDTTAFSDVSGSFLTAVPDTYLQNTDLTIVDNKITEISGVPLSAGDELPSGVMNTSALEYNAVNEISGYNGSAIAQYGAEKQWLVHDDTLVHAANSAQYALGVNLSAVAQLLGVDETVLFSGEVNATTATANLTEPISNFNCVKILCKLNRSTPDAPQWFEFASNVEYYTMLGGLTDINSPAGNAYIGEAMVSLTGGMINYYNGKQLAWGSNNIANDKNASIYQVIGIGRKS